MWNLLRRLLLDPEFSRKRDFLQSVSLFQGFSRREYGLLFKSLVARRYFPGDVLFMEGDIGRALFILEHGEVEICRRLEGGDSKTLAVLKRGDYFGEMSLLDEKPRTASAVARTEVQVYLLYRTEIDKLLDTAPRLAAALLTYVARLLTARLRTTLDYGGLSQLETTQTLLGSR